MSGRYLRKETEEDIFSQSGHKEKVLDHLLMRLDRDINFIEEKINHLCTIYLVFVGDLEKTRQVVTWKHFIFQNEYISYFAIVESCILDGRLPITL